MQLPDLTPRLRGHQGNCSRVCTVIAIWVSLIHRSCLWGCSILPAAVGDATDRPRRARRLCRSRLPCCARAASGHGDELLAGCIYSPIQPRSRPEVRSGSFLPESSLATTPPYVRFSPICRTAPKILSATAGVVVADADHPPGPRDLVENGVLGRTPKRANRFGLTKDLAVCLEPDIQG